MDKHKERWRRQGAAALVMMGMLFSGQEECGGEPGPCPECLADFAIYDPDYEDDGVWEEEVIALTTLLGQHGYTWQVIDHRDVNQGLLGEGEGRRFGALIAPGGYAYWRDRAVSEVGEASIRAFVQTGGGYIGFCAGTFWTADEVVWAEEATGGGGAFNAPTDYQTYDYDLGLLQGQAIGPFGWTPWHEGLGVSLEVAEVNVHAPAMAAIGIPPLTRFFYYGGPVFNFDIPPAGLEIWARAKAPPGLPAEARLGDGEPTVVHYFEGMGPVVLYSYHPEMLIGSMDDGVQMSFPVDETTVDWQTGDQSLEEINHFSAAIVRAGLQVALGEVVTP